MFAVYYGTTAEHNRIGISDDMQLALRSIHDFLMNQHVQYFYLRAWYISDTVVQVDFGSHTYFFFIKNIT